LVDREQIAQAASEISLTDLTMRAVADRLGVSVTSLYYHVRDRDELRSLAAQLAAARHPRPVPRDQHWAQWLAEWAEYTRASFVSEPGLLEHFINGTLEMDSMLSNLDVIVGVMEEHGFTPTEAMDAYALVSRCAIGAAVDEIRRPKAQAWEATVDMARSSKRMTHLAKVHAKFKADFGDQLCTVLMGIAIRRGDPPDEILEVLAGSRPS